MLFRRFIYSPFMRRGSSSMRTPAESLLLYSSFITKWNRRYFASSALFSDHTSPPKSRVRKSAFMKTGTRKSQKLAEKLNSRQMQYQRTDGDEENPPALRVITQLLDERLENGLFSSTDRYLSMGECAKLRLDVIERKCDDDPSSSPSPSPLSPVPPEQFILSVDSNILLGFLSKNLLLSGLSYAEFIASKNFLNPGCVTPISSLIRSAFFRRPSARRKDSKSREETNDVEKITERLAGVLRKKVLEEFPEVLRDYLTPSMMSALACSSSDWDRALRWLRDEQLKREVTKGEQEDPRQRYGQTVVQPLIVQCFDSGDDRVSTGLDLLRNLPHFVSNIGDRVHNAFWDYAIRTSERNGEVEAMRAIDAFLDSVEMSRACLLCLPWSVREKVIGFFDRLANNTRSPFAISETKIAENGRCESCGGELRKVALSEDEFGILRKEIVGRFVKNINLYEWSNPDELARFDRVLDQLGPFDVIVDGLNVVHSDQRQVGRGRVQKLVDVLTSLRANSQFPVKRVLVLLRPYVKLDIFPALADQIRQLSTVFVCSHSTTDDSFMLYGALVSGPNCHFLTNDLLRSQNEQLPPKTSALFQSWRRIRQIQFRWNMAGNAWAVWPTTYAIHPQATTGRSTYHFPLQNDCDEVGTKYDWKAHEKAMSWLCVRAKSQ